MIATLTFKLDVSSPQKAAALRDRHASLLAEDEDVTVISADMGRDLQRFTVTGVDTSTKQPFKEQVEAKDQDTAATQAVGSSKTRIVAEVRSG